MIVPLYVSSGKRAVAVLTPREKELLWEHLDPVYRMRGEFLLQTAMRITEVYHFLDHPEYYRKENAAIFLPNVAGIGKVRCTIKNRAVLLSPRGVNAVNEFLDHKISMPVYQSMEGVFKRAARDADFDTRYITTKMFRKTMISWLMSSYPEEWSKIAFSAGHDYATMQGHYITYGFRKEDVKDMRDQVVGWGQA